MLRMIQAIDRGNYDSARASENIGCFFFRKPQKHHIFAYIAALFDKHYFRLFRPKKTEFKYIVFGTFGSPKNKYADFSDSLKRVFGRFGSP